MEKTEVKRKLNHEKKGTRGITLIALVVTIIVLLILAGISIQMLTGENGILKRATQAREETDKAAEQEQRDLARINAMMSEENEKYTDKNGDTVVIPAGFAMTEREGESTVKEGLVITDGEGNEFVWVPCLKKDETEKDRQNAVKYEKDKSQENNNLAQGWTTNYSEKQYKYTEYKDWRDNGGDEDSVEKYGGFYVARYEAGIPSNATGIYASEAGNDYKTKDTEPSKNVTTYIPVSKKNNQCWNYISQTNAENVSANMYAGNSSITSQLIDSYAWDTIVEWMSKEVKDIGSESTDYGNYYNDSTKLKADGLYAEHVLIFKHNTESFVGLCKATKYKKGKITLGIGKKIDCRDELNSLKFSNTDEYTTSDYDGYICKEIATGSCEETKIKNIYDMAGNMWEWTTETGSHQTTKPESIPTTDGNYAVFRGGCFNSHGSSSPVSHRSGGNGIDLTNIIVGFRVVLYII